MIHTHIDTSQLVIGDSSDYFETQLGDRRQYGEESCSLDRNSQHLMKKEAGSYVSTLLFSKRPCL